jgi:hypothetical protein
LTIYAAAAAAAAATADVIEIPSRRFVRRLPEHAVSLSLSLPFCLVFLLLYKKTGCGSRDGRETLLGFGRENLGKREGKL